MADENNSETVDTGTDTTGGAPDANAVANAAAKAHVARFAEKALPTMLANAMKPLLDEIAALKTAAAKPASEDSDSKKGGKTSPEMAAMQAQLEDMKAKFAAEAQARAAAEAKSRNDSARSALKDALAGSVRPELLGMLTDHLIQIKGVVDFDDDGTPLFKTKKADIYGDLEDVRMPLKDGVMQYLKSEEAKAFLPSPGTSSATPAKKTQMSQRVAPGIDLNTASDEDKIRFALDRARQAESKS